MTVKLGNLLPGQNATLKSQIVSQVDIVGGHYAFSLVNAFYPDYKKHGVKDLSAFQFDYNYEVKILSTGPISNLSLPKFAEITEQNEGKTEITIQSTQAHRSVDLYYRTVDMLEPQLQYALSADGKEAAVSASLVPTFDAVAP